MQVGMYDLVKLPQHLVGQGFSRGDKALGPVLQTQHPLLGIFVHLETDKGFYRYFLSSASRMQMCLVAMSIVPITEHTH